jgi:hypothetical protein
MFLYFQVFRSCDSILRVRNPVECFVLLTVMLNRLQLWNSDCVGTWTLLEQKRFVLTPTSFLKVIIGVIS